MPEPQTTAASLLAGGVITITGSILGMQYDALIGGFGGGLMALLHQPQMPRLRAIASVAASCFLGGAFAPVLTAASVSYLAWLASVNADLLRVAGAVGIGLFAQPMIPVAIRVLQKKGEQA